VRANLHYERLENCYGSAGSPNEENLGGGFKLLAHKTSKEVVSGLTSQLDD